MGKTPKVFVDRCISSRALILQPATRNENVDWGGSTHGLTLHGWRRKQPSNDWLDAELPFIRAISRMSQQGAIKLYQSNEVFNEGLRATRGCRGSKGDLLSTAKIKHTDDAVGRSYFGGRTLQKLVSKDDVLKFCEFLRTFKFELLQERRDFWDKFPPKMQRNISNIARYRELTRALPHKKHWPDALHLWTAETNDADYFLTVDTKFIKALTMTAKIALPTTPIVPSELGKILNIPAQERLPFSDTNFIPSYRR